MKTKPGVEILAFDPCPEPFTGPSFEWGDFEAGQSVVRLVLRRFRRARRVDPCLGVRLRPRHAARRRREQRRRASNGPSRGDPHLDEDAAALLAHVDEAGGHDDFELNRAAFCVLHGWDYARWHAALDAAIETRRAFTVDDGEEVWIVRRAA